MADKNEMTEVSETPAQKYRRTMEGMARDMLKQIVPAERLTEATGRVGLAFRTAALANSDLYTASPVSVATALAMSAISGLMPGGPMPQAYILPRKEHGVQVCQWMISWRGMKTLVERTGARIQVVPVFEGDLFRVTRGLHADIIHEPIEDPEWDYETLRAVYVIVTHKDGSHSFEVMGKNAIEARRRVSAAKNTGPWAAWPIEMAMKTVIRYAISRGIAAIDESGLQVLGHEDETDRAAAIDVQSTSRPTPAPERTHQPAAPRGSIQQLEEALGRDAEDDDERTPEPIVAAPEPVKKPRAAAKPKEASTPEEQAAANEMHELLIRLKEGELRVGTESMVAIRQRHGITPSWPAQDVLKKTPINTVKAYVAELES